MFKVRKDEPAYAFIPNVATAEKNRYGKAISLVDENDPRAGQSLKINGDDGVGENPNRYKQHGFHFSADNCIGCHACEAACSEKNQLPAHISFRSVGYLEGGTYPAYRRMNISMACNHCDNPVCLKGCPTRAYTKHAEYGAVLQDPDTCFGCGYCTWVCPYNAPQLDPVQGQVSKCNMCVDRLEVGLKPACASACLGGALDFGLIETTPENRDQAKARIPGFPDPEISHPNIRFQQTRTLPREMNRTDSMPIGYHNDEAGGEEYKAKAVAAEKEACQWSLGKLRSREDPLVLFTLISQAVVGAFLLLFIGPLLGQGLGLDLLSAERNPTALTTTLLLMWGLQGFALAISTMHLGKPHRFYRAFNNLRYSPVSREVAALALFFSFFSGYVLLSLTELPFIGADYSALLHQACGIGAAISGPLFIYAMHKIYRIKARPFWDHWQVLTSFFATTLILGPLLVGAVFMPLLAFGGHSFAGLMTLLAGPVLLGLLLEAVGLYCHGRAMEKGPGEGAAAHEVQRSRFGYTYYSRNLALGLSLVLVATLAVAGVDGWPGVMAWAAVTLLITATALVGRALFYVLVIPTTMPGAFFWRNQGFQEHARESGLAGMPQTGVLPRTDYHHEQLARARREIKEELQGLGRKLLQRLRGRMGDEARQRQTGAASR